MDEQRNPYGPESSEMPPAIPQPPQPQPSQEPPHPNYNQQAPNYNQQAPNYNQQAPNYNQQAPNYNQQAPYNYAQMPCPESNLVWAILCTVLCCLPLGIVSIIYASKVDGCYATGRYAEAVDNSQKALKWAKIGAIISAVFWILYIIFYMAIIGFAISSSY